MAFENETSLGDFLKHLDATLNPTDDDGKPLESGPPLQFYVDPIGLEESEKTLESPVSIHLKQIPASTALELVLPQLGLAYHVRPDGIVEIEAELSKRSEHQDPLLRILDEIRQLRAEVAELRMNRGRMMGGGAGAGGGGVR